ncbi:hypothetical protein BaRGS_00017036 [Batillaria attramentaria]|uniref:B box-type domain-containing protein n=1 Tax=Batillaria attramentaria TaxID=370345 RepID=A0ABD0KX79_9CAEN
MEDEYCESHLRKRLKFFDQMCDQLVCRDCLLTDHQGHKATKVDNVVPKAKDRISRIKHNVELEIKTNDSKRTEAKSDLANYDLSVQIVREELDKIHQELAECIEELTNETVRELKRLAAQAREKQQNFIRELEKNMRGLYKRERSHVRLWNPCLSISGFELRK